MGNDVFEAGASTAFLLALLAINLALRRYSDIPVVGYAWRRQPALMALSCGFLGLLATSTGADLMALTGVVSRAHAETLKLALGGIMAGASLAIVWLAVRAVIQEWRAYQGLEH